MATVVNYVELLRRAHNILAIPVVEYPENNGDYGDGDEENDEDDGNNNGHRVVTTVTAVIAPCRCSWCCSCIS